VGKSERKSLTVTLDELWRRLVKIRDKGICRKCGKLGLEAHHIMRRSIGALRFNIANGITLCPDHHSFAHNHPSEFRAWCAEEIGRETYEQLEVARNWPELTLQQMEDLAHLYRGPV
jgi:hypothetical protein